MENVLKVDISEGIADIRLNRPHKRNAINGELLQALRDTAREINDNRQVLVVVLSGEGGHFSAGIDLTYMGEMQQGKLNANSDAVENTLANLSDSGANEAQQAAWAWQELRQPVIAAVEGCALGIGVDLALAADLRIIHPDARLCLMQIKWGLISDMSATQTLSRLVPLDVAKLLLLTGMEFDGREAVAMNLGTLLDDKPVDKARELACQMTQYNPDAVQAGKRVLNQARVSSVAEGLAIEGQALQQLMGTENQIEAVMARLEKRPPKFRPN